MATSKPAIRRVVSTTTDVILAAGPTVVALAAIGSSVAVAREIRPASLVIGKKRKDSNDQLLQP